MFVALGIQREMGMRVLHFQPQPVRIFHNFLYCLLNDKICEKQKIHVYYWK
jgi:hypothetical protein